MVYLESIAIGITHVCWYELAEHCNFLRIYIFLSFILSAWSLLGSDPSYGSSINKELSWVGWDELWGRWASPHKETALAEVIGEYSGKGRLVHSEVGGWDTSAHKGNSEWLWNWGFWALFEFTQMFQFQFPEPQTFPISGLTFIGATWWGYGFNSHWNYVTP